MTRAAWMVVMASALAILACVDLPSGPSEHDPATVRVRVTLPAGTPDIWSPVGETLYVAIRRAGRVAPIAETTLVVLDSLVTEITVPLAYDVERFVASAEVHYRGSLLFLGFEAAEFREGADTALTVAAVYVGPGARAATFELSAPDTTLMQADTARLIRVVRDTGGLVIPNVPTRFATARADLVAVDTGGLLTAVSDASDTARVTGYLPTGHSTALVVRLERDLRGIVTAVDVSPDSAGLTASGEQVAFSATAYDAYGTTVPAAVFTWESSDPMVATVSPTGVATAVANGSVAIRATADGVTGSATLTVDIPAPPPPPPPPPAALTRTWVGGDAAGPRDWNLPANWNPAGAPATGDTIIIAVPSNTPMLTAPDTVARVRIMDGTLTLNGHSLTVTGDFSTEDGNGTLTMLNPADTLRVRGNAIFQGRSTAGLLQEGALFVAGAFEQRMMVDEAASFQASGNHRTVLDGASEQRLRVEGQLTFGHLEVANAGGVRGELQARFETSGTFRISTPVAFEAVELEPEVGDSLVTVAGSRITAPLIRLFGPMAVSGAYQVTWTEFAGAGQAIQPGLPYQTVWVEDSVYLTGATAATRAVIIGDGGHVVVNGQSLTTDSLDVGGDASQGLRRALLTMSNAADVVTVTGNAVFDSDTSGTMSAGVLSVAGTMRVQRTQSFRASGTHFTRLNGAAAQSLLVAQGTRFQTLEITNGAGPLTVAPSQSNAEGVEFLVQGKLAIRTPIVVAGSIAAVDVADSLVVPAGSSITLWSVIARDRIRADGDLASEYFEFAGANQDIPPGFVYQAVTVSGSARLVGATNVGAYTLLRGTPATLTLNGHRLTTGSFTAGGVGEPTGLLVMTNAADSLVATSDVVFAGAPSAGLLSAGTVVAGGGFFASGDASAYQPSGTHRVVLNGTGQQVMRFDVPGPGQHRFNHLELAKTAGGVWLWSDLVVGGTLSTSMPAQTVGGTSHYRISAESVDVARITLDTVSFAIGAGSITRFDSVTFARQHRDAAQLIVSHAGAPAPFTFTGLQFLSTPATGSYVSATDVAPADGNVLTLILDESLPADGSAYTVTSGGAIVQWTGAVAPSFASVSGGIGYSCGLRPNGMAYCWGRNFDGQLGDGTTTQRNVPTGVQAEATFSALVAGGHHTCALIPSGAAYCWGSNGYGELGTGTTDNFNVPQPVTGGLTFTSIASGEQHTCALTAAGVAYCWGRNDSGQLGDGTTTDRLVPTAVAGGLTFTQIATKFAHTCALTATGAAYCWGHNLSGQLGNGTLNQANAPEPVSGGHTFAMLSAASSHTCGVTTAGAAMCWGWNNYGEVGDGTTTQRTTPVAVSGGLTFSAVSAGGNGFTCGLTTAGEAWCWGLNNVGQLGDGTTTWPRTSPVAVLGGRTYTALAAGFAHVLAIETDGSGYSWGLNSEGQLGDGGTTGRTAPGLVTPPETAP